LTDNRQGRLAKSLRRANSIVRSQAIRDAPGIVAVGLNDDNDALIS
jgi:hypothetical protein